jgi:hypothetical protein
MREQLTTRLMPSGQQVALQPELNVRLRLLFAARMNDYLALL